MNLKPGSHLGPYEVVSPLGTGGMGEVWKARDPRLGRDVAIKVLLSEFAADPDRLRRFQDEARAIAGLNHPHICQIYDVGPGYLVLEYIDGKPLGGPMPVDEAVRLARQIARALEAAHGRGILHRDLKPANILVTRSAGLNHPTVKLLDFGLAKLIGLANDRSEDVTRTVEHTVLGTPAYMSPEQAEGKTLDARSDIFSFGSVLYELLSGRRAFAGDTAATVVSALLRDDPGPLQVPSDLARIVTRCLAKRPDQRFQTITEVKDALDQSAAQAVEPQPSIAVLPFVNISADPENEYFSDGLAEEIINALSHVPGLKVIARTSAFAFKGKHDDIRRIAEMLGVAHVLEGSVRRAGNRVRVTAQLIAAADGSHLWSERYDREMADVFAIQDEISQAIASALQVKLTAKPAELRHRPTLPAYEAVLKGRHHMLKHAPISFARANECFEQAMALDPQYAEPHANLGLNHFLSAMSGARSARETMPLVRAEAREALRLDTSDPDPHFLLASVAAAYEYQWQAAVDHFAIAMAGAAVSAEAHWAYASLYLQPLGRFAEAVTHMEQAVESDPLNPFWRGVMASHLTHASRHDDAIRHAREAMDIDEANIAPHTTLGEAYVAIGRWDDAIEALEKAYRLQPQFALTTGLLAGSLVRVGERARADALIRDMGDTPRPPIGRVLYHWLCSDLQQAADWYERSINSRDPFALVFAHGPLGRTFRQSDQWPQLAKMMNLRSGE